MREIFRREIRHEKVSQNGPLYTTYSITSIKQVVGRWLHPIGTYSEKVWWQKIAQFFNELIL